MDKILVVDDEKKIVDMIGEFMKVNSIAVVPAFSGEEAITKVNDDIKCIILDINMDRIDGIEACKRIREVSNIPIIFLTANASQYTKVLGFGMGADDYVTKPFDPIELVARVKAHIRRYQDYDNKHRDIESFGNIRLDRTAHRVLKNGNEISLSTKEYSLLLYFLDNANKALSRREILYAVWKSELYDATTVNTYVKRLRDKIEDDKNNPKYIKAVRGMGYILEI